jgi:hypothetical protein
MNQHKPSASAFQTRHNAPLTHVVPLPPQVSPEAAASVLGALEDFLRAGGSADEFLRRYALGSQVAERLDRAGEGGEVRVFGQHGRERVRGWKEAP